MRREPVSDGRGLKIVLSLFGGICLLFGGLVHAATSPVITKIVQKDTKGTSDTSDDTELLMTTGTMATRVAVDAKGNVYITDWYSQRVYKYNSNGFLVAEARVLNRPSGIAIDDNGVLYIGGYGNGTYGVFGFDKNFKALGILEGSAKISYPSGIAISGKDIVVLDSTANKLYIFRDGSQADSLAGPFTEYIASDTLNINNSSGTYSFTRHRLLSPGGINTDENGNIYVTFEEYVEQLTNSPCSENTCATDENAHTIFNLNNDYRYWYGIARRYVVAMINVKSGDPDYGKVLRKIVVPLSGITDYVSTGMNNKSTSLGGIAIDNAGRLYVATNDMLVKVFDLSTGSELSVSGGFASGIYKDLAYDGVNNRMLAAKDIDTSYGQIGMVDLYGIDEYTNPINTAPSAPTLKSPKGTYVNALLPALLIGNSTDAENDPLLYGYEIKDANNAIVSTAFGSTGGANDETTFTVAGSPLTENGLYSWRAQASDGKESAWSNPEQFCVNEKNDNPSDPAIDTDQSTGNYLAWKKSIDPDCYDKVTYSVDISTESDFNEAAIVVSYNGLSTLYVDLRTSAKLKNGVTYHWRVKAFDDKGGSSGYGTSSFVYTTTVTKFESSQPDTLVYIDGNYGYYGTYLDKTPFEWEGIASGKHFVTFVKKGFEPYHVIADIPGPDVPGITVSATLIKADRIDLGSTETVLATPESGASSPFVVDYNNDGLKDLLVGDSDGKVSLFLSERQQLEDGSEQVILNLSGPLLADGSELNVGSMAVPFAADYNNDGMKDLVVGSGDGKLYLYINSGDDDSAVFGAPTVLTDSNGEEIMMSAGNSSPVIVDYNADGKKDLLIGSSSGQISIYLNAGDDFAPTLVASGYLMGDDGILDAGLHARAFFIDWNSDGKKDVVVGGSSGLALYLNVGTEESPIFSSTPSKYISENVGRRTRNNKEYSNYQGYDKVNSELSSLTGAYTNISPFIVNWDDGEGMDLVFGTGSGGVLLFKDRK